MTRPVFPFFASDISALARSLHNQLAGSGRVPGHVELLNMLARAAGSRNFQHFRAQIVAEERLRRPREAAAPIDYVELQRLSRYFDAGGQLERWPTRFSHQEPCLWVLWSKLPARKTLSGREMKERKMVTRTRDGSEYRRVERKPPNAALALIRFLGKAERY